MPRSYLFGPVSVSYAEQKLHEQRQAGNCLTFSSAGDVDLMIRPGDDWQTLAGRFPAGWQPDFLVLNLGYTSIPAALWSAPVPIVGLAQDWNLLWHYYRRCLRHCELVLTDTRGVEVLGRQGISHALAANLFGCDRVYLEEPWPEMARDIDILFVGNFNPSVQRQRLPWLARLAALSRRWNIVLRTGVFGSDYRRLLARSRIVFNQGIRGECNMRVFEAAAAGALLFQEADNLEVPAYFRDRLECIYYHADDLEALLEYYLEHKDERRTIAEAARRQAGSYSFAKLWEQHLERVEEQWPALQERASQRVLPAETEALQMRLWQALGSSLGDDPSLVEDLQSAVAQQPRAILHSALGLLAGLGHAAARRPEQSPAEAALVHFEQALACDPNDVLAALNGAEALAGLGRLREAMARAEQALQTLEQGGGLSPDSLDSCHCPPSFDLFRVEWERAAWLHAGQPEGEARAKGDLLRWRLHGVLAQWTGDLEHYRQARQARPDLWPSQAALGCAFGRAGRPAEAVESLHAALTANPFDDSAAWALYHALGEVGDQTAQHELAEQQRALATALGLETALSSQLSALRDTPETEEAADWLQTLTPQQFRCRFGASDTSRALSGYTNAADTRVVLTLLAHARPKRILEIGTALGHMTANLTQWSGEDAVVFTLGTTTDLAGVTTAPQRYETPDRQASGCLANTFGKGDKVFFITADSLTYDFRRLGPIDFAFIDGAHDLRHVLSDTLNVYDILRPGGALVWHDFTSPADWVEVRRALDRVRFREPIFHVAGTGVAFLLKAAEDSDRMCIVWEGAQQAVHSLAGVNRQMCSQLLARGHAVSVLASGHPGLAEQAPSGALPPAGFQVISGDDVPLPPQLATSFYRLLPRPADVHVRHQWPPQLTAPPTGHWIFMQPWEYGSIPAAWVEPLSHAVDEVWACSQYVRSCYLAAGIPAERVHVVPLGVDCTRFHPQAPPLPLPTRKRFKLLFVGGTLYRKGIDVLLDAYCRTFRRSDDVCLVIKDMGSRSFYKGQTAERRIRQMQEQEDSPEILYLDADLSEADLPGLVTACDCLVHPYRGEGFGLPIAEAMACGLPVVVTGMGAALDFCDESNAYLIPARQVYLAKKRVGELETVAQPWLAEPDADALAHLLRHAFEHPEEARERGQQGRQRILGRFTWQHAAAVAEERLRQLCRQPVRRAATRPTVALCMIVRNEEANLAACLQSATDLVDEIIIVDTGSTDRSREIAASFGAQVHDFAWVDSFAAARNEGLRHARADWIFWLDADDRLDADNRMRLKVLFAGLARDNAAFVMKCLCLPDPESGTATVVDHVRLFRNNPALHWDYRVHEQILPALRRHGHEVRWSDVVIEHNGYQDCALRRRKLERDRRLLEMERAERPEDPFVLFNLGALVAEQGRLEEAMPLLQRSLELSHPRDSIVRKLYALVAQCLRRLGQPEQSLDACRRGRTLYPDDVELLFQEGVVRREQGDRAGARECWLQLLQPRDAKHFASVDAGLCGYKVRHNLASVSLEEGDLAGAERYWRAALAEQPGFTPAQLGLAEVHLRQGRRLEREQAAEPLTAGGREAG